jgi:hypothetical protein
MLGARIFALTLGVYLTIGMQAQPSKTADTAKSQNPFASFTEFSATMVGSLLGNIDETKIYRSGKLMRTEMPNGYYFVTDLTTLDTFAVFPKRCLHNSVPPIFAFPFTSFRAHPTFQRTPVGEEIVDGHHCHVESVLRTSDAGTATKMRFWEADDLNGFPVKVEVDGPLGRVITIAYKNVKIGPPDPSVFKHPKSCEPAPRPH